MNCAGILFCRWYVPAHNKRTIPDIALVVAVLRFNCHPEGNDSFSESVRSAVTKGRGAFPFDHSAGVVFSEDAAASPAGSADPRRMPCPPLRRLRSSRR